MASARIRALWGELGSDPVLMRAQLRAMQKQLPLLFILLGTNVLALAFTHHGASPPLLTVYAPALFLPLCIQRAVAWLRYDISAMSVGTMRGKLRISIGMVAVLGVVFTAWSLALVPYGDAYAKTHVAFFMSITVIGCIFCLMHLRSAALVLTMVVTGPFMAVFLLSGTPVLVAIALNFGTVAMIMTVLMFRHFDEFSALVRSQRALEGLSEENSRLAHLDSLTGLANRRSFFRDLESLIDAAAGEGRSFALGIVDLDGFKPVNDVYGHGAGDVVLTEVGRRLGGVLGTATHLARLGGDEFGFVLPGGHDPVAMAAAGRRICDAMEEPIVLPTGVARIGASIGFAVFPEMARDRAQLIERADYALYFAKEHRRGRAVIFSSEHEAAIRARSTIEQELRRADLAAELHLHFQPIVDVSVPRVMSFEALARWQSPRLGPVSPAVFIEAAERIGLIGHLTEILLGQAIEALRGWPSNVHLSFNLSTLDIASPVAIARLATIIENSGIAPQRIALEITESALLHDFETARNALLALKATGIKISLDDFGTGYSSLGYVHRLPIDKIKVDRSFMTDLLTDKASRDVVKTVVDLCRNLNLLCIIEGVETAEHLLILRSLGCRIMQGYHFSRPVPGGAVAGVIEAFASHPAERDLQVA